MPRIEPNHVAPLPNLVELYRHQRFDTDGARASGHAAPSRPDRVEISEQARWMSQLQKLPSVREEMVNRIRAQVKAGTYDVAAKLDAALDQMIDDLPLERAPRRLSA